MRRPLPSITTSPNYCQESQTRDSRQADEHQNRQTPAENRQQHARKATDFRAVLDNRRTRRAQTSHERRASGGQAGRQSQRPSDEERQQTTDARQRPPKPTSDATSETEPRTDARRTDRPTDRTGIVDARPLARLPTLEKSRAGASKFCPSPRPSMARAGLGKPRKRGCSGHATYSDEGGSRTFPSARC
jgi:hypothetical protein